MDARGGMSDLSFICVRGEGQNIPGRLGCFNQAETDLLLCKGVNIMVVFFFSETDCNHQNDNTLRLRPV